MNTTAVVTDTLSGHNARHISAFRGEMPVFAKCYRPRVMRELALSYGVFPSLIEPKKNRDKTINVALQSLLDDNSIGIDDTIVYVGSSFGIRGRASFLEIIDVKSGIQPRKAEDLFGLVGPMDL